MNKTILGLAVLVLVGAGAAVVISKNKMATNGNPDQVSCTMEAKLCPDGSYVGRSGPKCEFAACPSSGQTYQTPSPISGEGTVQGKVTTSPTCPVERVPPEPGCAPKPYATTIHIRQAGKQAIYKDVQSGSNGTFKTNLPAGSYVLDADGGPVLPRCSPVTVSVKSGQTATADISCDSGIR